MLRFLLALLCLLPLLALFARAVEPAAKDAPGRANRSS